MAWVCERDARLIFSWSAHEVCRYEDAYLKYSVRRMGQLTHGCLDAVGSPSLLRDCPILSVDRVTYPRLFDASPPVDAWARRPSGADAGAIRHVIIRAGGYFGRFTRVPRAYIQTPPPPYSRIVMDDVKPKEHGENTEDARRTDHERLPTGSLATDGEGPDLEAWRPQGNKVVEAPWPQIIFY
ncbi:unnamed protein product, partial [Iphiclides podalirius]